MEQPPSLLGLCQKALESLITKDVQEWKKQLEQLPVDLIGNVLMNISPIILQEVQDYILGSSRHIQCCSNCAPSVHNTTNLRKRARTYRYEGLNCKRISLPSSEYVKHDGKTSCGEEIRIDLHAFLNSAWKDKFEMRWPKGIRKTGYLASWTDDTNAKCEHGAYIKDWQQSYWEAHLQDCLREAVAQASVPCFEGSIGKIVLSDTVLGHIGIKYDCTFTRKDSSTLKYHCGRFGQYARHLRLRNVLCGEEICDLLKTCRLQGIVFDGIKSKKHIDGTCQILNQNRETLEAVELFHCRISSADLSQIGSSLNGQGTSEHRIHFFSMTSSRILINDHNTSFNGFLQFLSGSRYLQFLKFSDNGFEPTTATLIFTSLFQCKSYLYDLELCDNKLSGWLSWECENFRHLFSSSRNEQCFLRSLTVLNLRGNLLESQDTGKLKFLLEYMPQLQKLDLSDNPIGDDGLRTLIPYFQDSCKRDMPLLEVKIANCNISCVGASLFFDSISTHKKSLQSLGIAHNNLGSSVATSLSNFLKNAQVEWLDIEGIGLDSYGCSQLQEAISYNRNLVYLNLSKNRGGLSAAIFLSDIISHSHKISVINASYNNFRMDSLKLIATALNQSKGQIRCVDLGGNPDAYHAKILGVFDEFQSNAKDVVILPSSSLVSVVHDDDP